MMHAAAILSLLAFPQDVPWTPIFNGRDLGGWKAGDEAKRHWIVRDGILDYDGRNAELWTEASFGDVELKLSWRFPGPAKPEDHPVFDADGHEFRGPDGRVKTLRVMDAGDSGVLLRGFRKAQANLFFYPCGSGEVWEYRTDPAMPAEVRRACMPTERADRAPGDWNDLLLRIQGERLWVTVNGRPVIHGARLPGMPARGPFGLQHEHGPVQFRDLAVRELP